MLPDDFNEDGIREGEPPYFGNRARGAGARTSKTGDANGSRRYAIWNFVSVSAPFVGLFCGVCAALAFGSHFHWDCGFYVWLGFGVAGLLAALIALVRAERLRGLTVIGVIVNAGLVLFLVKLIIDNGRADVFWEMWAWPLLGLTVIGLMVNVGLFLFLVKLIIDNGTE
jgi:hypothetical protein